MDPDVFASLISDYKHVQDQSRFTPEQLKIWSQNPRNVAQHQERVARLQAAGWKINTHDD